MSEQLSFTALVKNEIAKKEYKGAKARALLAAFLKINGRLNLSQEGDSLYLKTENAKIAKFLYTLLLDRYGISARFAFLRDPHFDKFVTYQIIIDSKVQEIIDDLEMFNFDKNSLSFIHTQDDISGYCAGAFLATGSCNNPKNSNYHLEIVFWDEDDAKYASKLIGRIHSLNIEPKMIKRRNQYVLYIKRSNQIADFLAFINAEESCLEFENVRIYRDYVNNGNRLTNCYIANYQKSYASALKQVEEIKLIDKHIGIDNLPNEKMKLLCHMRLEDEESTMADLAAKMEEKLHTKVSKSGVNHIFRAIHELANRIKNGEENEND